MDLYLIVGNPNTRKSSVMRSLTGCFNRSLRDIQPSDGRAPIRLYVRVGALQETRCSAEELAAEARRQHANAVLCGLWPQSHPHEPQRWPDAATYLAAFDALGFRRRAIAVLGQNGAGLRGPKVMAFPLAPRQPLNVTAQGVRQFFGWV
ncbi:MAG: hypothetical protein H6933_12755 [Burkholderiaceae bacterium]|nr:hypothetical protein [Burkholderiaceae bacterium]